MPETVNTLENKAQVILDLTELIAAAEFLALAVENLKAELDNPALPVCKQAEEALERFDNAIEVWGP